MSGHSKWANIKRTKAKVDAQKGKAFSRVAREIILAARRGGGNPDANFQLRTAVLKAKEVNMPADNIRRAIEKGTGAAGGAAPEEFYYEGYGPGGAAVMLLIVTDNRNRTAGDVRFILSKNGGNLGETGCVSWMFSNKGIITVDRSATSATEDDVMLTALEAGAEDISADEEEFEILTAPEDLERVAKALEAAGLKTATAETRMIPSTTVEVAGDDAHKMLRLIDMLEDHDDVNAVYTNADIPDEAMEAYNG
ncbi:MAG: YebC/PmpR family DNA-binding transcriptional regulator [Symbiobacteriia bacterium]